MKTHKIRKLRWVCLPLVAAALAIAPQTATAQQSNEVAVVTLSSYNEIIADINYIGGLGGQPMLGNQLEGMLGLFTGGQGLVGLEKSKPIGVVVNVDGGMPSAKAMIPVNDLDALLGLVEQFGVLAEDAGNGVKQLTSPQGPPVFVNENNGIAVISNSQEATTASVSAAQDLVGSLASEYDLAFRVNIQNIPADYRDMAIMQLRQGMEQGMGRNPNESDEQYQMRKQIAEAQIEQFVTLFKEAEQLTVGWAVDRQEEKTYLDFVFTAAEGTKLASQLAEHKNLTTNYAGFYEPNAAGTMTFSAIMADEDISQARQMLDGMRGQILNEIASENDLPDEQAREVVKEAFNDFFDAFVSTIEGGKLDGGAVLNMSPDAVTFVAGGLVGDPAKVESGLKKLEALAEEEEEFPGISWNADKHGDISFHTMHVPVPDHEDEARQLFGDQLEVAIGTGGKSVYFSIGKGAIAKAKQVIDASNANRGKKVPPFEMTVALTSILETVAGLNPDPMISQIADTLKNEAQGRDHVRIVEHIIDNGVKARIELESGVLKAIGSAVKANQGQ